MRFLLLLSIFLLITVNSLIINPDYDDDSCDCEEDSGYDSCEGEGQEIVLVGHAIGRGRGHHHRGHRHGGHKHRGHRHGDHGGGRVMIGSSRD